MAFSVKGSFENAADDGLWSVAWSHSGSIVAGSCDETVRSFVLTGDGEKLALTRQHELRGHELGVTSVTTSAEGGLAASSALDSHIRVWSLDHGTEELTIDAGPVEAWTVSLSADGKMVASGSQGGNVNLWSVDSGEKLHTLQTGGKFTMSVAVSPDGSKVACGANDGAITVFDANTHKQIHKLDGHAMSVRALASNIGKSAARFCARRPRLVRHSPQSGSSLIAS